MWFSSYFSPDGHADQLIAVSQALMEQAGHGHDRGA